MKTQTNDSIPACPQVRLFATASALSRMRAVNQMAVWVTKRVSPHISINAVVVPVLELLSLRLFGCPFDNLMNPLPGEIKTVGDLCERLAAFAEIPDFGVSRSIWFWSWLERAPGPSWNTV